MGGALNRVLAKRHLALVPEADYRPQVSHGSIALLKLGFPDLPDDQKLLELRQEFLDEYARCVAAESSLFNGIEDLLAHLEEQSIPWGIITNKPEYLTLDLLNQLELTDRCCCIVGADTAARAKPHPEPMQLACSITGVASEACIYVGDAERDIQAGRSVNMLSLIAGWGYIDPVNDDPQSWNAYATLDQPDDLLEYLTP